MNHGRKEKRKEDKYIFGNRMKEERIRRGLSQQAVADAMHISQSTLSRIENGITVPDLQLQASFLEYFGLTGSSPDPEPVSFCTGRICISGKEAEFFFYSGLLILSVLMKEFGPLFAFGAAIYAYRHRYPGLVTALNLVWTVLLSAAVLEIYVYPLLVFRFGF